MTVQFFLRRSSEPHLVVVFTEAPPYQVVSPVCQLNIFRRIIITRLIDSRSRRSFVANALQGNRAKRKLKIGYLRPYIEPESIFLFFLYLLVLCPKTATIVSIARYRSVSITATYATCGCPPMNTRTTVLNAAFAVLGVLKISNIAMTAACALIVYCTIHITARLASTSRIVLSVRNTFSVLDRRLMKCLVGMQFTGNVSAS